MALEIIPIEDVYIGRLERMLDDTSVVNLIDDKTNVPAILPKVVRIIAFYHKNFRMFKDPKPEYGRRMRLVKRLFVSYQEVVMD